MDKPIFITGAPRSGKGIIAGILDICGVFSGEVDSLWENQRINQTLLNPYLTYHGCDGQGWGKLPVSSKLSIPGNWKEKVDNCIMSDGYERGLWMLKSTKIALTWPVWEYHYPRSKHIIVRRRTGDIVSSCLQTGYMSDYYNRDGWVNLVREYEKRFVEMISEGLNCKVIWPHRMAYGDYEQVYELLEWLGLGWKTEILTHIDPKFWKTRKNRKS